MKVVYEIIEVIITRLVFECSLCYIIGAKRRALSYTFTLIIEEGLAPRGILLIVYEKRSKSPARDICLF